MGTNLFGMNVSGMIYGAMKGKLVPLTLTRYTPTARDPENLAGGLAPTATVFTGEGFIDDKNLQGAGTGYQPTTIVKRHERQVSILGDSLLPLLAGGGRVAPMGEDPETGAGGDKVTISGLTYAIIRVRSDPAQALYICAVRR